MPVFCIWYYSLLNVVNLGAAVYFVTTKEHITLGIVLGLLSLQSLIVFCNYRILRADALGYRVVPEILREERDTRSLPNF